MLRYAVRSLADREPQEEADQYGPLPFCRELSHKEAVFQIEPIEQASSLQRLKKPGLGKREIRIFLQGLFKMFERLSVISFFKKPPAIVRMREGVFGIFAKRPFDRGKRFLLAIQL